MNNIMCVMLIVLFVLVFIVCKKEEVVLVVEVQQVLVVLGKDDDVGWKKYLQVVVVQNMGNIINSLFLYYFGLELDLQFQDKYECQVESVIQVVVCGVQLGNMLVFGLFVLGKMVDMIQIVFKDVLLDLMKGVCVVFIGQVVDNVCVQFIVQLIGVEYIFVEVK